MRKAYDLGTWYLDLPSARHLEAFRELRRFTEDEGLLGLCHIEAEAGLAFLGKPLHHFEGKIVATLFKNLFPSHLVRSLKQAGVWNEKFFFKIPSSTEVFTQKEIDRISLDLPRFDQALALSRPEESPFLALGGRYTDWLLGLGRVDLIKEIVSRVRRKGFLPIFLGRWATFVLPKAKALDVVAYAVPINMNWSLFDLEHASSMTKKFDRPLISLNPLSDGRLLNKSTEAFSFLFNELKIAAAITEISTDKEWEIVVGALKEVPSLILPRKTSLRRRPKES